MAWPNGKPTPFSLLASALAPSLDTRADGDADYDNLPHDDWGPRFNVTIWFLTGIAAVFFFLRLYCKYVRRKKLWWDDYVLIAAFIFLLAQTSLLSVYVHLGFGKHTWDITNWPKYLLVANITGVLSIIAAAWSKTSFAILLLRFTEGGTRRLVWFVIVTVNLFLGLSALFTFVQCSPVKKLWDSSVPGHCWPSKVIITYNSFSSAWSGAMDILLALLPWRIINRRALNKKERLGVLVAMSMGVFAGTTSIAKTATLSAIGNPDTIASVSLMILATAETAITIMAASIPILRALIRTPKRRRLHPSTPHFYEYYPSTGNSSTLPPASHTSDRGLVASPDPALTPNGKYYDTLPASPLSGALSSPGEEWPRFVAGTWFNSASEDGVEMPARDVKRGNGTKF